MSFGSTARGFAGYYASYMPKASQLQLEEKLLPPQNLDAEMALLGAAMLSEEAVTVLLDKCIRDHFYLGSHLLIFDAIRELSMKGETVDLVTVQEWLLNAGHLDNIGGTATLLGMAEMVPAVSSAAYYAEIVKRKALLRKLLTAADEIKDLVRSEAEFDAIFDGAQAKVLKVCSEYTGGQDPEKWPQVVGHVLNRIEESYKAGKAIRGLEIGYPEIDSKTGGFEPGDLAIIGARPSVGKTSLALHMAMNVAKRGIPVVFFSLEMSSRQLSNRVIHSRAGISAQVLRHRCFLPDEMKKIRDTAAIVNKWALHVNDAAMTPTAVRAYCRKVAAEQGTLGLVFVDYMQLMASAKIAENRQAEVSAVSRDMKLMAGDLGVPVVCLSQLNRASEARDDRRPQLSDLRETGAIEQDADMVILLWKDKQEFGDRSDMEKVYVDIAKNRNGPTGVTSLNFTPSLARFTSAAPVGYTATPVGRQGELAE